MKKIKELSNKRKLEIALAVINQTKVVDKYVVDSLVKTDKGFFEDMDKFAEKFKVTRDEAIVFLFDFYTKGYLTEQQKEKARKKMFK